MFVLMRHIYDYDASYSEPLFYCEEREPLEKHRTRLLEKAQLEYEQEVQRVRRHNEPLLEAHYEEIKKTIFYRGPTLYYLHNRQKEELFEYFLKTPYNINLVFYEPSKLGFITKNSTINYTESDLTIVEVNHIQKTP